MGDWTGTVPTFPVGNLRSADMTTMADIDTALVTAWTTWPPTLTNLTLGNGTQIAKYRRLGKTIDYRFKFLLGSTSAVGTSPRFTLPAAPSADYAAAIDPIGVGYVLDSGTTDRPAEGLFISGSTVQIQYWNATPATAGITATVPWTWTTGDLLQVWGTYYID